MNEDTIEKRVLYIVIFILFSMFFVLFFWMFTTLKMNNFIDEILGIAGKVTVVLGGVFTLITINIARRNLESGIDQLKEMKLQRTHAQEPDIFIESQDLNVDYNEEEIIFNAPWRSAEFYYSEKNPLPVSLTNIGNGVAKYVSISVCFKQDYLEMLKERDKNKKFNIRLLETDYGMSFFQYGCKMNTKESYHNFDINTRKTHQYNYIKSGQSVEFMLDYQFIRILNLHVYLNSISNDDDFEIPRMEVKITYFDSFHNRYTRYADIYIGSYLTQFGYQEHAVSFKLDGLNRKATKQLSDE